MKQVWAFAVNSKKTDQVETSEITETTKKAVNKLIALSTTKNKETYAQESI